MHVKTTLQTHHFNIAIEKKTERLQKHAKSKIHTLSMTKWLSHQISQKRNNSILMQLNNSHQITAKKNRDYLRVTIETLVFTAQQNIAQRGDENRHKLSEFSDMNRDNFLELLHLRSKDIPRLAAKLYDQAKVHRQWTSPDVQNELLSIFATLIIEQISKCVTEAQLFGVIADKTADISNKEQFSICLRYVLHGEVFESFVGFCETSSTTDVLYQLLKSKLLELGLDIEHLGGQCYDGASNMSGSGKGVAARVQEVQDVHCHAHLLNLALQDTLENNEILRNGLGVIQSINNFFNKLVQNARVSCKI